VGPIVRGHHEHWDGAGYPDGLSGEAIPIGARIVAVVDAHDAMTHNRPYRDALSAEQASAELLRSRGTQFDPELVDLFLRQLDGRDRRGAARPFTADLHLMEDGT
jgi:putative two-component system response regulator